MKIVLDTNAYRGLFAGENAVIEIMNNVDEIILPIVVLGELLEAFKLGTREGTNRKILDKFLREVKVSVGYDGKDTAEFYAQIRIELHKKGKPIPMNDVWIAAVALENSATLVTFDGHFSEISDLKLWPK